MALWPGTAMSVRSSLRSRFDHVDLGVAYRQRRTGGCDDAHFLAVDHLREHFEDTALVGAQIIENEMASILGYISSRLYGFR